MDRIEAAIGLPRGSWARQERVKARDAKAMARDLPGIERSFPGRQRWVLRTRDDGACTFLRPDGCVLEPESRPTWCRLYPLALAEAGRFCAIADEDKCLAVARACGSSVRLLSEIGMTALEWLDINARYQSELVAHAEARAGGTVTGCGKARTG